VNLTRPEIEHFYSKDKHFKVIVIVNGRQKIWTEKIITFEQVVVLAFGTYDPNPDRVYTGLGGTGSYILDLVSKTPVNEILLFDSDDFLQHNAFRSTMH
jgi:hypothetical protein